jgi:hypothetical protein
MKYQHELEADTAGLSTRCATCYPAIYIVQLDANDGVPVSYYFRQLNNELTDIDVYLQREEDEWEAKKAAAREQMWDILCATPIEAGFVAT